MWRGFGGGGVEGGWVLRNWLGRGGGFFWLGGGGGGVWLGLFRGLWVLKRDGLVREER